MEIFGSYAYFFFRIIYDAIYSNGSFFCPLCIKRNPKSSDCTSKSELFLAYNPYTSKKLDD